MKPVPLRYQLIAGASSASILAGIAAAIFQCPFGWWALVVGGLVGCWIEWRFG